MCYSDHIVNHIAMLIPKTHYEPAHNAAHTYYELGYGHYELVIAARGSGPSQGVGCKSYGVLVPVPAPTQYGGGAGVMH